MFSLANALVAIRTGRAEDLWWIESDSTFRGMYVGGNQAGDLGNQAFLDAHVRGRGALGNLLVAKMGAISNCAGATSLCFVLEVIPIFQSSTSRSLMKSETRSLIDPK